MSLVASRGRRILLELEEVTYCPIHMLGTELKSSAELICALDPKPSLQTHFLLCFHVLLRGLEEKPVLRPVSELARSITLGVSSV